jgi:hypothetical protein
MTADINAFAAASAALYGAKEAHQKLAREMDAAAEKFVAERAREIKASYANQPAASVAILVAADLANMVNSNRSEWSGGSTSVTNAFEACLRDAAARKLDRLLARAAHDIRVAIK